MWRLDWYLARRYLASRKGGRLLSFITWVALGGVIVGVTALVVVIGVMTGMQEDLRDKILAYNPHVLVLQTGSSLRMDDWHAVLDTVRAVDGVTSAAPFVLANSVLERGGYSQFVQLYGVLTDRDTQGVSEGPTDIETDILRGVYDLDPPASGLPPVILGSGLAATLQAFPGDTLNVLTLESTGGSVLDIDPVLGLVPKYKFERFQVTGTFTTGMYEADTQNAYTSLEAAQAFMGFEKDDDVSGIGVRTVDAERATVITDTIRTRLGLPYHAQSWIETNRSLFSALKLEKIATFIILSIAIAVASFCIVCTLLLMVTEKGKEIAVLKALGASNGAIMRIFMLEGIIIGAIGTIFGVGTALAACTGLSWFGVRLDPDVYYIDRLPVNVNGSDYAMVAVAAMIICTIATIYPARAASTLSPVDGLRYE